MRREAPGEEASHGGGKGRTGWALHTAARPPCSFGTVGLHTCREGQLHVLVGLNKKHKKGREEKKQETGHKFLYRIHQKKIFLVQLLKA